MPSISRLAIIAAAVAATPLAAATYTTTLSGANETIPNATTATGTGILTISADQNFASVELSWAGLVAPANGAHIHCCAALGANAPIAIDFDPPPVITGSVSRFYDLTLLSTYRPAFVTANGGTVTSARSALLSGLTSELAYYNVHNPVYPGGQIRGQLELTAVPEPASWALMIGGFGLVGSALRRRRVTAS